MTKPDWRSTEMPVSRCPYCDKPLDAASAPGRGPKRGDVSVCIFCAGVMQFDAELRLVRLSSAELREINRDNPRLAAQLVLMRFAVRELDRRQGKTR